ncbi:MAG: argininosuccinate lyase [Pseudorhodobacter sp.]
MRAVSSLLLIIALAACGADGAPSATGVQVSGEAATGVVVTN